MQIILLQPVEKLGNAGDVKDVTGGYFRNFLFPRGLAERATAAGLARSEQVRARMAKQYMREQEVFRVLLESLQKEPFIIRRKATQEGHLFGSVSERDIALLAGEKGYVLDEKRIQLDTHIKELGTYPVLLKFDDTLTGAMSLTVERDTS